MCNIVVYLLCIVLTAYLNLMYEISFGPALLACEIVLPFLCLLQALYLQRRVSVNVRAVPAVVRTGGNIQVKFCVSNRSRIPLLCAKLRAVCAHGKGRKGRAQVCRLQAAAKGKDIYTYQISAGTCGLMHIEIRQFTVYDYFRLFRFRVRAGQGCDVTVLPAVHDVNLTIQDETRMFPGDGSDYSPDRSGDDPSEVFCLREYRPGDRPQSIHWKLSARTDSLYVKEYGYPIQASVMLILEGGKALADERIAQAYIETAISLSYALWQEGCAHCAAWLPQDKDITQVRIHDEESFQGFVSGMLELMDTPFLLGAEEILRDTFPVQRWLRTLTVTDELTVLCDGVPILNTLPEDVKNSLLAQDIMI